jgi:hypothetical protein
VSVTFGAKPSHLKGLQEPDGAVWTRNGHLGSVPSGGRSLENVDAPYRALGSPLPAAARAYPPPTSARSLLTSCSAALSWSRSSRASSLLNAGAPTGEHFDRPAAILDHLRDRQFALRPSVGEQVFGALVPPRARSI